MITGITLEIKALPSGRRVLYFPYMAKSDRHWGTGYSRAKRDCHMLQNTITDRLDDIGDLLDGEHMKEKTSWNFGPYHRQGMAEHFRKVDQGVEVNVFPGNHDEALRGTITANGEKHRSLLDKSIYGINIADEGEYIAPDGKTFLIVHGDKYDKELFKTEQAREFWYGIGNNALNTLYAIDTFIHEHISERFSVAARGKRVCKTIINQGLGVRKHMMEMVDKSDYDGVIYGHSHMPGFERTPGGKLMINDGAATDHVYAAVHDKQGRWAILMWHSHGLGVHYEDGKDEYASWQELGLREFLNPAMIVEDQYTQKADRVLRLVHRLWPPKDWAQKSNEYRQQRKLMELFRNLAATKGSPPENDLTFIRAWQEAEKKREDLKLPIPLPERKPSNVVPFKISA